MKCSIPLLVILISIACSTFSHAGKDAPTLVHPANAQNIETKNTKKGSQHNGHQKRKKHKRTRHVDRKEFKRAQHDAKSNAPFSHIEVNFTSGWHDHIYNYIIQAFQFEPSVTQFKLLKLLNFLSADSTMKSNTR